MRICTPGSQRGREGHTDDTGEAFVPRDGLAVVAFAALERLCEVDRGLVRLPLEVELVDAALGDH